MDYSFQILFGDAKVGDSIFLLNESTTKLTIATIVGIKDTDELLSLKLATIDGDFIDTSVPKDCSTCADEVFRYFIDEISLVNYILDWLDESNDEYIRRQSVVSDIRHQLYWLTRSQILS